MLCMLCALFPVIVIPAAHASSVAAHTPQPRLHAPVTRIGHALPAGAHTPQPRPHSPCTRLHPQCTCTDNNHKRCSFLHFSRDPRDVTDIGHHGDGTALRRLLGLAGKERGSCSAVGEEGSSVHTGHVHTYTGKGGSLEVRISDGADCSDSLGCCHSNCHGCL